MIQLEDVNVVFTHKDKKIEAVKHVNLHVKKGEVFGIVGFSGAGKSTLVRTINCLQRPTSGAVLIEGVDITKLSESKLRKERERIGMIFQHFNLMQSRTVLDNVLYALKRSSLTKEERKERAIELLRLVDIADKIEQYPSQLSGGQKQRVAIARALANNPKILLCDEATSALDPQTTKQILKLLKQINETLQLTIVIITHEMEVVKEICHKVAVMEHGSVVEEGKIFDIFAKPKEETTKRFIASVNHIHDFYQEVPNLPLALELGERKRLIHLTYIGSLSQEPIMAELLQKYHVVSNIIYGNLENIGGTPIGNLAVTLEGEAEHIELAITNLLARGALVEEIYIKEDGIVRTERSA